ncbi:hypothetical protein FA95DRAFT_1567529 [Auriscalpium vulgare]|uniref:Uncharacterized protein n=1 Tax=Auriscalpium vulgare TaxID=40419 RepID=A0ACB8R4L3_9AGAM|nr:hypothetical protein FA95DRAFT_1567529 [Auriscalpium vulgare]
MSTADRNGVPCFSSNVFVGGDYDRPPATVKVAQHRAHRRSYRRRLIEGKIAYSKPRRIVKPSSASPSGDCPPAPPSSGSFFSVLASPGQDDGAEIEDAGGHGVQHDVHMSALSVDDPTGVTSSASGAGSGVPFPPPVTASEFVYGDPLLDARFGVINADVDVEMVDAWLVSVYDAETTSHNGGGADAGAERVQDGAKIPQASAAQEGAGERVPAALADTVTRLEGATKDRAVPPPDESKSGTALKPRGGRRRRARVLSGQQGVPVAEPRGAVAKF